MAQSFQSEALRLCSVMLVFASILFYQYNRSAPISASSRSDALLPEYFMSTKAPYPAPNSTTRDSVYLRAAEPEGCRLHHVNHIGRHGSRHLTKLKKGVNLLSFLDAAAADGSLTSLGRAATTWTRKFLKTEEDNLGDITEGGRQELFDQGVRFSKWQSEALERITGSDRVLEFDSTFKKRARDSRDAFIAGLTHGFESTLPTLDVQGFPQCEDGHHPPPDLHTLRFFDSCSVYKEYTETKAWKPLMKEALASGAAVAEAEVVLQRRSFTNQLFTREFDPVALELGPATRADLDRKVVEYVYALCQIQWNANRQQNELCGLFKPHMQLLSRMEMQTDLEAYFKKGAGHPLAHSISCRLLQDFVEEADAAIEKPSAPFANFRFAHAETLMPFIALLRLYGGGKELPSVALSYGEGGVSVKADPADTHAWVGAGAVQVPMAANVAWLLYDCGEEGWKVLLTHNERVRRFPVCPSEDLCPWAAVKAYYLEEVYQELALGTCSHDDWEELCGGILSCSGTRTSHVD